MTDTGATPRRATKLIKALAESQDFTSVEVAETLWLAMQMEPATTLPDAEAEPESGTSETSSDGGSKMVSEPASLVPPPVAPPRVNLSTPTSPVGVLPPQTLPIWVADPSILTDPLAIIRALRPLLQKVDAGTSQRLNEAATADMVARTQLCIPVLEPQQVPWFDVILVADRGSSMYIWGRLLQDIVRILRHYGAFRDVRVFDLVINSSLSNNDDQV